MFKTEQDIKHEHLDEWLKQNVADKLQNEYPVNFGTIDTEFIDESHTYYLAQFLFRISATGFIHSFFPHFNEDKTIERMISSGRPQKDPRYEYYGMSAHQIKEQWKNTRDEACTKGTRMHAYTEYKFNDLHFNLYEPEELGQEYVYLTKFYNAIKDKWKPFRTELNAWSLTHELIGQCDIAFQDIDAAPDCREIILGDHKRSKEIKFVSFGNEMGYGPVNGMMNCNFNHYSIQLNIYKWMIEKYTGYIVKQMFILVFSDTNDDFLMLEVVNLTEKVEKMLQYRLYNLINQDIRHVNFFLRRVQHQLEDENAPTLQKPCNYKRKGGNFKECKQKQRLEKEEEDSHIKDFLTTIRPLKFYYDKLEFCSFADYIIENRNPMIIKIDHCKILYRQFCGDKVDLTCFDKLKGWFNVRNYNDVLLFLQYLKTVQELWKECETMLRDYLRATIDDDVQLFCSGSINYLGVIKETEEFVKKFYK